MTEMIIQVDEHNNVIGLRPREDFYSGEIIHRSSQLLLFNSEKQLMLQKRSLNKRWYPGLFTYSISGTVKNETNDECMKREMVEEVGIDVPFKELFTFRHSDDSNDEFVTVYSAISDQKIILDKSEISASHWVTLKWLKEDMALKPENYSHSFLEGMKVYWGKYGVKLP